MTRETKIGLLVGLAFILVIGILLTDQRRAALDPTPADLSSVGGSVRGSTSSAGRDSHPTPLTWVPGNDQPHQQVPTQNELNRHQVVVPSSPARADAHNTTATHTDSQQVSLSAHDPNDAIQREAHSHGEDIVPVGPPAAPSAGAPPTVVASTKVYKAQSGDTVSRMAAKFLGGNTRVNRQAIIDANPSLQNDPDSIAVGQSYTIPVRGAAAPVTQAPAASPATPSLETPTAPTAAAADLYYTVQDGDSLWAIANDQLGDSGAVAAIKELNKGVLKGANHDVIHAGMKLRLPARPLASAN